MRIVLILIFQLFISGHLFSQVDLNGEWVCNYRTKYDNSKIIEPGDLHFRYQILNFHSGNKVDILINNGLYEKNNDQDFLIRNDTFWLGNKRYTIEKFSNDSLILIDIDPLSLLNEKKRFKYFFIWKPKKVRNDIAFFKGKDTLIPPSYFEPFLKKELIVDIARFIFSETNWYQDTFLLYIDNIHKNIKMDLLSKEDKNDYNDKINQLNELLMNRHQDLTIPHLEQFPHIIIPYITSSGFTYFHEEDFKTIGVSFYNILDYPKYPISGQADYAKEQDNIQKAIESYHKGKLEKSIRYFLIAHHANKYNVETMMNLAAIYFENKQKDKACEWWQKLTQLEQTEGTVLYNHYCK